MCNNILLQPSSKGEVQSKPGPVLHERLPDRVGERETGVQGGARLHVRVHLQRRRCEVNMGFFLPRVHFCSSPSQTYLATAIPCWKHQFSSDHWQTYNLCSAIVANSDHSFFPVCGSLHFQASFHLHAQWKCRRKLAWKRNHIQGRRNDLNMLLLRSTNYKSDHWS